MLAVHLSFDGLDPQQIGRYYGRGADEYDEEEEEEEEEPQEGVNLAGYSAKVRRDEVNSQNPSAIAVALAYSIN